MFTVRHLNKTLRYLCKCSGLFNEYCQDINVRHFVMHQAPPSLDDIDIAKRQKATNVEQQCISSPHAAAVSSPHQAPPSPPEITMPDVVVAHGEEQATCTVTQVLSCAFQYFFQSFCQALLLNIIFLEYFQASGSSSQQILFVHTPNLLLEFLNYNSTVRIGMLKLLPFL